MHLPNDLLGKLRSTTTFVTASEGTFARLAPGIQINVLAIYPNALPRHTELGVPFSQL